MMPGTPGGGAPSCLPSDDLSHFERREQELLALNQELDRKKVQVLADAQSAVTEAQDAAQRPPPSRPATAPAAEAASLSSREAASIGDRLGGVGAPRQPRLPPAPAPTTWAASATADAAAAAAEAGGSGSDHLLATIRFQNARIVALQEELDRAKREADSRGAQAEELAQEVTRVGDENAKLKSAQAKAEPERDRLKEQLAAAEARCRDVEQERAQLTKEKDQFGLQRKKLEAELSTKETRINRLTEEMEKQKASLKAASGADRDRAGGDRREIDRLTGEVRKLERQRAELVAAFKKQMKLIEVLKRQRAHMEAAKVLSFTEDEFIRVLELGDKLGE